MRNFLIKYTEHNAVIFGDGINKNETLQGTSEKNVIENFLKLKRSTGQIAVNVTAEHIPIKEPMQ